MLELVIGLVVVVVEIEVEEEFNVTTLKEAEAAAAANNSFANVAVLMRLGAGNPLLEFANDFCNWVDGVSIKNKVYHKKIYKTIIVIQIIIIPSTALKGVVTYVVTVTEDTANDDKVDETGRVVTAFDTSPIFIEGASCDDFWIIDADNVGNKDTGEAAPFDSGLLWNSYTSLIEDVEAHKFSDIAKREWFNP